MLLTSWLNVARSRPRRPRLATRLLAAAERLEPRALLSGQTIAGTLWNDQDFDGVRDAGEPGLAGRTVYIDADNDGRLNAAEPTATTDGDGNYSFNGLAAGTYVVRQVLPDGWRQTVLAATSPGILAGITGVRDLVLDQTRGLLYVTTDHGVVERIDLASGTRLTGFTVGANLLGADITPDGRALYIAEGQAAGAQGVIHKVDLTDGSISSVRYTRDFGEAGAYDVAIGANGKGLVTTQYSGSGSTPLRSLDTATDTLATRSGAHDEVQQNTQIHRSGDGSLFLLTESNISSGPIFTYDVATDSFPRAAQLWMFLGSVRSALNRDGSLIAMEVGPVAIADRNLKAVENLTGITAGFAFDPTKDVFYGVDASDASNDWVVAFDTHTWKELYRFRVGENVTHGGAFGSGTMRVTADGRYLTLATPAGVRVFDLVARSGGRTATVTDSTPAQGVDFGSFAERLPEVRIGDASVTEGNSGTRSVVLTVTLSEPTYRPVRATYAATDGSATSADLDYTSASGAVIFAPGETSKTITVFVRGDTKDELSERVLVNLMGATGGVIADGQAVVTVVNDDTGARGSIGGTLWNDADSDGVRDAGEAPLVGWMTYIDSNNNGRLDSGELTAVTGDDGRYVFTDLPAGEYTVAQVLPSGAQQTSGLGLTGVAGQTFFLPSGTGTNLLYRSRDLVYDASRNQLLVTTADGTVERLDLADMRLLDPFKVGNSLLGADVTADGGSLYVAESLRNVTQGFVRKVNLADGSVTNLAYDLDGLESGAYDIAIMSNGRALVTTLFAGSGWVPLRNLDLATGTFSDRTDLASVRQNTDLYRSADRARALLLEGNSSAGPVHTYNAVSDTFPAHRDTQTFVTNFPAAVSRDGSINAIGFNGLALYDANLQPLPAPVLSDRTTGLAFDPRRNLLYRAGSTEITVFETANFTPVARFPIGETLGSIKAPMAVSDDGRFLFLGTGTGVRVYRLVTDARRVTLAAGQAVTDVDFLNHPANPNNNRPTPAADAHSVRADQSLTGNVLSNDTDPDSDPLTVVAVNGSTAAVGSQITLASGAKLTLNADGSFTFDPRGAFVSLAAGQTAQVTFTYAVSDGNGGTATAAVTVTVEGVNDPPTAGVDSGFVNEDAVLTAGVLANDSDPDGDALVVSALEGDSAKVGVPVTLASGARLTLNADGTYAYDPNGAFGNLRGGAMRQDSFSYTISDGHGGTSTATVTIHIVGTNESPTAGDDSARTNEHRVVTGNVLGNDTDPDSGDGLTVSAVNGSAANVGATVTLASGARVRANADGTYVYDPNGAFVRLRRGETATDSFTYTVSDGRGGTATATVTITIEGGGGEDDLVGFLNGSWWVGASDATKFTTTRWAAWVADGWQALRHGDFNADGRDDVLGLRRGQWWVGLSTGSGYATRSWGAWADRPWQDVLVGDLNADGRDDVLARLGGQWWASLSTGSSFTAPRLWAAWSAIDWRDARLADFTGDGRADLAARNGGAWWVGRSDGAGFATSLWANWFWSAEWQDVNVGDFDGDGKADLLGREAGGRWTGAWTVGRSTGAEFSTSTWDVWTGTGYVDIRVGDFNGDGRTDLLGRRGGAWWVSLSTGSRLLASRWDLWSDGDWKDVTVGDFDGDGRDDVAARRNGNWWVGRSTGSAFARSFWGTWAGSDWRAVAASEATGLPPATSPAATSSASFSAAFYAPPPAAFTDDEPLALFWTKSDKDDEFAGRLLAAR